MLIRNMRPTAIAYSVFSTPVGKPAVEALGAVPGDRFEIILDGMKPVFPADELDCLIDGVSTDCGQAVELQPFLNFGDILVGDWSRVFWLCDHGMIILL
jgi:hypothetical protein